MTTVIRDKFLQWVGTALIQHGVPDMEHDVFLMISNAPTGPQPSAVALLSARNPLLGQPPLQVANIMPLYMERQQVIEIVGGMVEHLTKQRAELMAVETP